MVWETAVAATILVASVGVKSVYQLCKMLTRARTPVGKSLGSAVAIWVLIQLRPGYHLGSVETSSLLLGSLEII